jgi:hypothetical protein
MSLDRSQLYGRSASPVVGHLLISGAGVAQQCLTTGSIPARGKGFFGSIFVLNSS